MTDRISVLIAVPIDNALPVDVQGVGLRRRAIELMQEVATVDENTVRYKGATDNATIDFGGVVGMVCTWQHNLLAVQFIADGQAHRGVCGPVAVGDRDTRTYSVTSVVRSDAG
ncbi:protein GP44 [Mycolicibacterium fortuitum]|uniref:protein GP44 n=1 Tax=Mycolicibacterium fortuitum TaxID=1766 RepID=UPI0026309DAD|nr:protein GP44 [Mycolicibacterium fortuitum]